MRLPSISQVRLCRGSTGTLAFTQHQPITAVFEYGMIKDQRFPEFERRLDAAFRKAGVRYTMHWSKNSGLTPAKLEYMYGAQKIASWKAARRAVFGNDQNLMKLFETDSMVEAGLAERPPSQSAALPRSVADPRARRRRPRSMGQYVHAESERSMWRCRGRRRWRAWWGARSFD